MAGRWRRDQNDEVSADRREVAAEIELAVLEPTTLEFQIAAADLAGQQITEKLRFAVNGKNVDPQEIIGELGTRIHRFEAGKGNVTASYQATVVGRAEEVPVSDLDLS